MYSYLNSKYNWENYGFLSIITMIFVFFLERVIDNQYHIDIKQMYLFTFLKTMLFDTILRCQLSRGPLV